MRLSQFPLFTLKETPADAEVISHQLMLRAGLIRKLASGLYTWLPLGLRVLHKVERIIREEMARSRALEVLMPAVQPAELWQASGRWSQYGPELLRLKDRHDRPFCFGPTHEEVITDLARRELKSYKQLPITFYQIQTKFRDEVRPRFGIMRAREFLMKDAYSFHLDQASLDATYETMFGAYQAIFTRLGLNFRAVAADTGSIGGNVSHEFHVLADSGEDAIAFSDGGDYAANLELARTLPPATPRPAPTASLQAVMTPGQRSIAEVSGFLQVPPQAIVKTLLVEGEVEPLVALVLRGDHELNVLKAEGVTGVKRPLRLALAETIVRDIGCEPGFVGPVGLKAPVFVDYAAAHLADFVCGANATDQHLTGVNWGRDLPEPKALDLRNAVAGDPSPRGEGVLEIVRGIEVGHVFQLGDKYSRALGATVLNEQGHEQTMIMGCYGIGVTRVVAAAIEQNHDDHGIIWPHPIAPFAVALAPIGWDQSAQVREAVERLYQALNDAGLEVLLDDRNARPGVMFADLDLIGIPHRIVLSERSLKAGMCEYKARAAAKVQQIPLDQISAFLKAGLSLS